MNNVIKLNKQLFIRSVLLFITTALPAASYASVKCDIKSQINTSVDTTSINGTVIKGAIGDGITDDTLAFQAKLRECSNTQSTCYIPEGINHLIKGHLFMWGDACLVGPGTITFDTDAITEPYLLSFGISGKRIDNSSINQIENVFSGQINDVNFVLAESASTLPQQQRELGRILYFFRTDGAVINSNTFEVGSNKYSATSSGNHNDWLSWVPNYIRNNITITNNTLNAQVDLHGSEGIGLGWFTNVLIENNTINGVGDDPVAVHWCTNVEILNNTLSSTDGRLFSSNSVNVEIANNTHTRIAGSDGSFHKGIALIWTGFENNSPGLNNHAPTNHYIHDNTLIYNDGSIDNGAAISMRASRGFIVEDNVINNNSALVTASAIHIWPTEPFEWPVGSGFTSWDDPDNLDDLGDWAESGLLARVHSIAVRRNIGGGDFPQKMVMTGMGRHYIDPVNNVIMENNVASWYQNFEIYGVNITTNQTCPAIDALGNICDSDLDGDGVANGLDNCPDSYNPNQSDTDSDAVGNVCDIEQLVFTSIASEDGWVRESSEDSNEGGALNTTGSGSKAIRFGDHKKDRQFKSIVSFDTSLLITGSVVKGAQFELTRGSNAGDNDPYATFGIANVDLSVGGFGGDPALAVSDFEATADISMTGQLSDTGVLGISNLDSEGLSAIEGATKVQLRIEFELDDNDDRSNDYVGYYSSNNGNSNLHPRLIIDYTLPD